jgi:septation ring formation regulator EzrA
MVRKQGKHVGARIQDPKVWNSFLEHVKQKHGKVYGVTGIELQNALTFYLEHPEAADINEIKESHSKELQVLQDMIMDLEKGHENQVQTYTKKLDEISSLNNQMDIYKNGNKELQNELKLLKEENERLKSYRYKLDEKTEQHDKLLNQKDKLRNKYDHLQERFNKSQEDVINLERELNAYRIAVNKIQSLSFMDRLFNRIPKDVKELGASPINKRI